MNRRFPRTLGSGPNQSVLRATLFSMPNYCLHLKVTVYVCVVINTAICLSQVTFVVPVLNAGLDFIRGRQRYPNILFISIVISLTQYILYLPFYFYFFFIASVSNTKCHYSLLRNRRTSNKIPMLWIFDSATCILETVINFCKTITRAIFFQSPVGAQTILWWHKEISPLYW